MTMQTVQVKTKQSVREGVLVPRIPKAPSGTESTLTYP
jgi:hypothetical protein